MQRSEALDAHSRRPAGPSFNPQGGFRWGLSLLVSRFLRRRVFDLEIQVEGREHIPAGESLIVAAAPHRNGMDAFCIVHTMPEFPRVYFLGSREAVNARWINRVMISIFGGVVPVATSGQLNREALETALAVLASGASLGIFPEGWDIVGQPPDQLMPIKRGVGFLAVRSRRRVLPVALAGTHELWRGKVIRLRIGPPLEAAAEGTTRERETALASELERALVALRPPLPPQPADGRKPWRWLTHLVGG